MWRSFINQEQTKFQSLQLLSVFVQQYILKRVTNVWEKKRSAFFLLSLSNLLRNNLYMKKQNDDLKFQDALQVQDAKECALVSFFLRFKMYAAVLDG